MKLDIKGKHFGECLVLEKMPLSGPAGTRWKSRCNCGNEFVAYGYQLKNGHTRSCGCIQPYIASRRLSKRPYEFLFNILKHNAKVAHRECDMTYDEFVKFTSTEICHYCGDKVIWNSHRQRKKNYSSAYHLDRKDNSQGYTTPNCVVCCSLCNSTKTNQFSYDEMCEIGKVIREIKKRRILNGTDTPNP